MNAGSSVDGGNAVLTGFVCLFTSPPRRVKSTIAWIKYLPTLGTVPSKFCSSFGYSFIRTCPTGTKLHPRFQPIKSPRIHLTTHWCAEVGERGANLKAGWLACIACVPYAYGPWIYFPPDGLYLDCLSYSYCTVLYYYPQLSNRYPPISQPSHSTHCCAPPPCTLLVAQAFKDPLLWTPRGGRTRFSLDLAVHLFLAHPFSSLAQQATFSLGRCAATQSHRRIHFSTFSRSSLDWSSKMLPECQGPIWQVDDITNCVQRK